MTSPNEIPGFHRNPEGSLEFDGIKSPPLEEPDVKVIEWNIFYYAAPCLFGYSPSSEKVMEILQKSPTTEFVFCTPARGEDRSFNITYLCVPHRREITIHDVEVYAIDTRELLYRFPDSPLDKDDEKIVDEAIVRHILPLVADYA